MNLIVEGVELLNRGKIREALALFNAAPAHVYPEVKYLRSLSLARLGHFQDASSLLEEFCTTHPNHQSAKHLLDNVALKISNSQSIENISKKSKLKVAQLVSFYEVYTQEFYRQHPELIDASLETQSSALLADGFAALHYFAPGLKAFNYDSRFIIVNCDPMLSRWAADHKITQVYGADVRQRLVAMQVDEFEPDVLFISHPISGYDSEFVHKLRKRPKLVMGWRAAAIPPGTDWSEFDIMLSHLSWSRQEALKLGAKKALHFHPGVPASVPQFGAQISKEFDIVISAQWTPEHATRNRFISAIVQAIESGELKASLGLYLNVAAGQLPPEIAKYNQGPRWAKEMHQVLASGRIVVNGEIDLARGEAGNMRLFEVTGTGSFLLTQYHANILQYFTPGTEIETFADKNDLLEKIKFYLANPEKRDAIAKAGHNRCLKDYSMEKQCEKLNEIIRDFVEPTQPDQNELADILNAGIDAIENRKFAEALVKFETILASDKNHSEALQGKAISLVELGRLEEAVPVINLQLTINPENPEAKRLLEAIESYLTHNANLAQGKELLKKATQLTVDGSFAQALDCCIEIKRLRVALRDLDYIRGICFIKLNRLGEARESLKEELRYFPDNSNAAELLETVVEAEGSKDTKVLQFQDQEFFELYKSISTYTMAPPERLFSLFCQAKEICLKDIPGNFVECGVAAGGSSALLSAVIKRYSKRKRLHYAFDSYEGMPTPTEHDREAWHGQAADATGWGTGTCSAPETSLMEACQKVGSDDIVIPVKGYFENTLPVWKEKVGQVAFLHMDGDWYESTKAILQNLYTQVTPGGVIQVDDYGHWVGCKKALHEFEGTIGTTFPLNSIDGSGVWFLKQ